MVRKLRMGMFGGGKDAFIGGVHRMAAALDGQIELVCGAFSSTAEKSLESGKALFAQRTYADYAEMLKKEAALSEDIRMDFVAIVTPNFMHFPMAKAALKAGFHVICDKPMTLTVPEAEELAELVDSTGLIFALTHNYTGYPMVKQAKNMVANGELGEIRKVMVEYPQGWLATDIENEGQKQADWRTDPAKSGVSCSMGDIGSHAENLVEYITGLEIESICADLTTFIPGRLLDDDASMLLRFNNGANGTLTASQISVGEENSLKIRIHGTKAGLEWQQMEPNTLFVKWIDKPVEVYRAGNAGFCEHAEYNSRLPAGHPEGFIEAFANIYRNFAHHIQCKLEGIAPNKYADFPTVQDGVRGMKFIVATVESSNSDKKWLEL